MLSALFPRCPDVASSAKCRGSFSLTTYIERYQCRTEVLKDTEGEFMTYAQYEEHARTAAGGRLSSAQITRNWQTWTELKKSDPDSPEVLWDLLGSEDAPLRFWVKTKDKVVFRSAQAKMKEMESRERALKNASTAQVLRRPEWGTSETWLGKTDSRLFLIGERTAWRGVRG